MALKITDELGKELIASGQPVVIDFWAEWCGPCRQIGPFVDELATEYEGRVAIGKYNVDEGDEISGEYGIRNIPTLSGPSGILLLFLLLPVIHCAVLCRKASLVVLYKRIKARNIRSIRC